VLFKPCPLEQLLLEIERLLHRHEPAHP